VANTNRALQIELPDGWEDQTVHFFMGPEESGMQHTLTVMVDPAPDTRDLAEYSERYTPRWVEALPNSELLSDQPQQLEGGSSCWSVVCKSIPAERQILLHKRWYLLVNKTGFICTASFTKRTIKTIGVDVERTVAGLAAAAR